MIPDFKDKIVTVVGLARSGIGCAKLLKNFGADVRVTDFNANSEILKNSQIISKEGIEVEVGKHSKEFLEKSQIIILSPGVKEDSIPCVFAKENKIPVISEIEVAWYFCKGRVIAVTGTNAKSTMVALIAEVLKKNGERAFVLGNIGESFSAHVLEIKENDFVCLEISSFQLEKIKFFKPDVSVFLNFSCDHLDRYKDIEEYFQAKKRIFMNQDEEDFAVLNYDDLKIRELKKEIKAKVLFFKENNLNPNLSCALKVCSIFGIDEERVLKVYKDFKGLEHRLEFVESIDSIDFINDSKSTNVNSTLWALRNIKRPVILIAGGRDKGLDFSPLKNREVLNKIRLLILVGEAKDKIKSVVGGLLEIKEAETLEEAVLLGKKKAKSGDCVLFSPMCASFDMFRDFEERGKVFKEIVRKLES